MAGPLNFEIKILKLCQWQKGFVVDFGEERKVSWNLHLRRNPLDFEIPELSEMLNVLEPVPLSQGRDKLQWSKSPNGNFLVKSCYTTLQQHIVLPTQGMCLPLQLI